jgi:hypothetical protein
VKRRRLVLAAAAMVFAFAVGITVAFRQLARAQSRFDPNKIVAAEPSLTVVTSPGVYRYDGLDITLKVWVDARGIVQYDLSAADGAQFVHSTERASTYSRWAFVLDEKKRLWFYSSDVGLFLWDGGGAATRGLTKDDPLRSEMPNVLQSYLPQSLRR